MRKHVPGPLPRGNKPGINNELNFGQSKTSLHYTSTSILVVMQSDASLNILPLTLPIHQYVDPTILINK
ncbi:hypothetical protein E2C01_006454 [Portunus trituberculatus]|uniref:Uncharacterized protein n=1 Tax=Portunus trituberculatus TaxID=210409 RepID=A0A5B7CWD9_PORTR|nr:hypothetical protein [Portunus trituberculatus]